MTYYVPKTYAVYAMIIELIHNKNEISLWGNILSDQVKFVLAIYLTTTNLHNGFSIPHLHAVSQLANISQCNNCADLMCWNAFNCEAWWSSHCWSYWEFVEDLINVDRPQGPVQSRLLASQDIAHNYYPTSHSHIPTRSAQLFQWVRNFRLLTAG